jgi:hypothetical protein
MRVVVKYREDNFGIKRNKMRIMVVISNKKLIKKKSNEQNINIKRYNYKFDN